MKKTNRYIISLGVIIMIILAWYMLFDNISATRKSYYTALNEARRLAELKIYDEAEQYYFQAYEIKPDYDLGLEIAKTYLAAEEDRAFEDYTEDLISNNRTRPEAYDMLLDYHYANENYETCVEWLDKAAKNRIKTDKISVIQEELKKKYKMQYGQYLAVKKFSNGICAVQSESELWSYISDTGSGVTNADYVQANGFSSDNFASVKNEEGEFFLIDEDGKRRQADSENRVIEEGTMLIDGLMAIKVDGKYIFVHADFSSAFGSYDAVGCFNNQIAPVKEADQWYLINEQGEKIQNAVFDEVVLDELGIMFRQQRGFVKRGESYIMIDTEGKQVGTENFEEAVPFSKEGYAAVKKDGKWGFIDTEGKLVIEPKYEQARSFSNGYAAVSEGNKWGYIDEKQQLILEYQFDGAMDFSDARSCFVKLGDVWSMLKFYL